MYIICYYYDVYNIYSLDFYELAVEERFALADLDHGYGLVVVVDHAERRWFQLVSRVRLGRTLGGGVDRAKDGDLEQQQPQEWHRHRG